MNPSNAHTRPSLTLVAVCLGGMMVALDGTAVTIAAPAIAHSIHASLGQLELIANVYLVVLGVAILPAGIIADRLGRRRTFVIGVLGFGACSLGVSVCSGAAEFIALRAGQGLFGAMLQPAALAILATSFPREKLGPVLGIWGAVNAMAIGLGPVLAGAIVQGLGWPAVFIVNGPVAVIATVILLRSTAESHGAGDRRAIVEVLAHRRVRISALAVAVSSFGVFGLLFLLTLFLQNVRGLSPSAAGLWMLVPTLMVVVGAPAGGILAERLGPRLPVAAGMVIVAAGMLGLTRLHIHAAFLDVAVPAAVFGLGTGAWMIAATQTIVTVSKHEHSGAASAVQQACSQLGGVIGVAVFGQVISARIGHARAAQVTAGRVHELATKLAFTGAMHTAFLVCAAVTLLSLGLAWALGTGQLTPASSSVPSPACTDAGAPQEASEAA